MSIVIDETIRGAANQVWETAGAVERAVNEILAAFREGRFDPEPVGSPAYVRRLRDQAAVAIYAAIVANPDRAQDTMGPVFDWQIYRDSSVDDANVLIAALGYPVPEDKP